MIKDVSASRSNSLKQEFIRGAKHFNIPCREGHSIVTLLTDLRDTQQIVLEVLHQAYLKKLYKLTHDGVPLTNNFTCTLVAKRDVGPIFRFKGG